MDPTERTLTGATIAGRYRVVGKLGSGGIGEVYAAEQIGLDRQVAVKVIRKGRRGDQITEKRFMREARAAGRISSPHVVTLYDFGRDEQSGLLYLAMEMLEGESLAERLDDPTLIEMQDLLKIAASIARGLRAAHEAGVLHRDLKPANVFLCEDGTVKVLDFGIAKLMDDERSDWEPLTQVNRILGTPVYMSPEAATRRPLGPTSDLYSLGLILYEMVVGEPPFKTGNAMKTLKEQVERIAPRVIEAAPWRAIPEDLDALIEKMLQKNPQDRPRDAGEVVEALEGIAMHLLATETVIDKTEIEATRTEIEIPVMREARREERTEPPQEFERYEDDEDDEVGATTVWEGRGPDSSPPPALSRSVGDAAAPAVPVPRAPREPNVHYEPPPSTAGEEEDEPLLSKRELVILLITAGVVVFGLLLLIRVLFFA